MNEEEETETPSKDLTKRDLMSTKKVNKFEINNHESERRKTLFILSLLFRDPFLGVHHNYLSPFYPR